MYDFSFLSPPIEAIRESKSQFPWTQMCPWSLALAQKILQAFRNYIIAKNRVNTRLWGTDKQDWRNIPNSDLQGSPFGRHWNAIQTLTNYLHFPSWTKYQPRWYGLNAGSLAKFRRLFGASTQQPTLDFSKIIILVRAVIVFFSSRYLMFQRKPKPLQNSETSSESAPALVEFH